MKDVLLFDIGKRKETPPRELERQMRELAGVFTDPLIVHRSPWMDTLPGWLKEQVTTERLLALMQSNRGKEVLTATDAEALAYLYPASLDAPLDRDWSDIYLYLATRVCAAANKAVPEDVRVEKLSDWQTGMLRDLKGWIYRKRKEHRPKERKPEEVEVAARAIVEKKATPIMPVQPDLFEGLSAGASR
jgi:hypothetical protein